MKVSALYSLAANIKTAGGFDNVLVLKVKLTGEQYESLFNTLKADPQVSSFDLTNDNFFRPIYFGEALGLIENTKKMTTDYSVKNESGKISVVSGKTGEVIAEQG